LLHHDKVAMIVWGAYNPTDSRQWMGAMSGGNFKVQLEVDPSALESPALEFLRSYWNGKCGTRTLPSRSDLKPSELKRYLDSLSMVDVIDGGREFRYRLVGTAVTQYFFIDPTGKTTAEVWPIEAQDMHEIVLANLRNIVRLRKPVHAAGTLSWPAFRPEPFEALYLPFSDNGEDVTLIVNMFSFERARVLLDRQVARQNGRTRLLTA
jgi:hypothetical protein